MKPLKYMPCTIQKMSSYYIPLLRSFRHCIQCLGARAKIKFILTHHHPRRVLSCSNFILPRTTVLGIENISYMYGLLCHSGHSKKKLMLNSYLLTLAGWLLNSQNYPREI